MVKGAIGLVFGIMLAAGHLLSWNIEFTNDNGQALWRGCGLCVLASVIVFTCSAVGMNVWGDKDNLWLVAADVVLFVAAVAYVTARLILIYLTIHSFSDLPAGVYDDINWLQYIPFFH